MKIANELQLYGEQTGYSLENFKIGDVMPIELIRAITLLKIAAAKANLDFNKLSADKSFAIRTAANAVLSGDYDDQFPLKVYQTGSGTQTNMNVNEVIASLGEMIVGVKLHPNDDVNMSQSSNDVFPSAMHVALTILIEDELIPAANKMAAELLRLEEENAGVVKIGRTHLQDAVPMRFSDELSGYRAAIEGATAEIKRTLKSLKKLAIGGTAVGNGLNAPTGFDEKCVQYLNELTKRNFTSEENKFYALGFKDAFYHTHNAVKVLAQNLYKIANDIRHLSSGPRAGLNELIIPHNEAGSSIMAGKVNPTQCEAMMMAVARIIGNDETISFACTQGNYELNVFMPVMADTAIQSVKLLSASINSFVAKLLKGLKPNLAKMKTDVESSLMIATALNEKLSYSVVKNIVEYAERNNLTIKQATLELTDIEEEEFDKIVDVNKLV